MRHNSRLIFGNLAGVCCTTIVCILLLAIIAYFAQATFDSSSRSLDASNTLTFLTVTLAVSTTLLSSAVAQAFKLI